MKYKHIYFEKVETTKPRKTEIWECRHNEDDYFLGEVKWHGAWRQYCFFPEEQLVFSRSCLIDISHFIQQLMDDWKSKHFKRS